MENNLDFSNHTVMKLPFKVFGEEFAITDTIVSTWIIMGVLILLAIIVKLSIKNYEKVPKGFQNFIEIIVSGMNKLVENTMGAKNKSFAPYFGMLFIFILISNLSGLVTLRPPTADVATTLAMAIITFGMIQFFGMKEKGLFGYIKSFFQPIWALFPLNVIGELANPISLGFRLFGNILGGTIILALYYTLIPWAVLKVGIPVLLHGYLDVFAGILQAFIFVMLSMTFVAGAMEE